MGTIHKLLREAGLKLHFYRESLSFAHSLCKYNASAHTDRDVSKMQYTILRINHTLEKGMSLPSPRKGFGHDKAIVLLRRLGSFMDRYGKSNPDFVLYPLGTIESYLDFCEKESVVYEDVKDALSNIKDKYTKLSGKKCILPQGGIEGCKATTIQSKASGGFEELLESRHSQRAFSRDDIPEKQIIKALELAQKTPSACNRQGWKTHVFKGARCKALLEWQDGCHGFEDQPNIAILVCADLRAFLSFEIHQAYVDGGLYAMNLINSLHFLGFGTIPISCGFDSAKIKKLHKLFEIPENEVPIVIVGAGIMTPDVIFASSRRKAIEETNTFHR